MNTMLKTMYRGYQRIVLIGRSSNAVTHFSESVNIAEAQVKSIGPDDPTHHLGDKMNIDMVVIDVDSVGVDEAGYLHFLALCFQPETPVVMMGTNISPEEHQRFLASGVLEVVSGAGTSCVECVSA